MTGIYKILILNLIISLIALASEGIFIQEGENEVRIIEKIDTLKMRAEVKVYVPLEVISDVEITATLVDDQEVTLPFSLELNKNPDSRGNYKIKFSENEIDIDNDGVKDTFIYSTEYIKSRIVENNYIIIKGGNISNEGEFYKRIYLTVEVE